jgi:nucleosome binding factor SPN SPT16 subunit
LSFSGCPHKSVVKIRPTKKCLIAISEPQFFVIEIDDIEFIYFERLSYGIKNFDMAIIFKDLVNYKRINSIPVEHIEEIKNFFDTSNIIFAEGVIPMQWANVL